MLRSISNVCPRTRHSKERCECHITLLPVLGVLESANSGPPASLTGQGFVYSDGGATEVLGHKRSRDIEEFPLLVKCNAQVTSKWSSC